MLFHTKTSVRPKYSVNNCIDITKTLNSKKKLGYENIGLNWTEPRSNEEKMEDYCTASSWFFLLRLVNKH